MINQFMRGELNTVSNVLKALWQYLLEPSIHPNILDTKGLSSFIGNSVALVSQLTSSKKLDPNRIRTLITKAPHSSFGNLPGKDNKLCLPNSYSYNPTFNEAGLDVAIPPSTELDELS